MYGPHLYDPGLVAGDPYTGTDPEAQIVSIDGFRREAGVAALIGEFGYSEGAKGGEAWLARVVDKLDVTRVSATLWEYSQAAELWNDEDLSIVDADGAPRPILKIYVRPWLRAVAGTASSFHWDATTRVATAAWTGDGGVSELVLPPEIFEMGGPGDVLLKTVAGPEGACLTHDPERGELRALLDYLLGLLAYFEDNSRRAEPSSAACTALVLEVFSAATNCSISAPDAESSELLGNAPRSSPSTIRKQLQKARLRAAQRSEGRIDDRTWDELLLPILRELGPASLL